MATNRISLKTEELAVINMLGEAWNAYAKLPEYHDDDTDEFRQGIHALQNMVMGRVAVRAHPTVFYNATIDKSTRGSAK
jgi:hypothetical protein